MATFDIRRYRLEDVDEVYEAALESRDHIGRWMSWLRPDYSREDARQWVEHAVAAWEAGTEYEHVIVDSADGSIVGSCGLNLLNRVNGFCNLGYWVRASRLGEGAAVRATLLLRDLGFGVLGLNRLEIVVAEGNAFSRGVAEKAGAVFEGVLGLRLMVGEVAHDACMYAFLSPMARRASVAE